MMMLVLTFPHRSSLKPITNQSPIAGNRREAERAAERSRTPPRARSRSRVLVQPESVRKEANRYMASWRRFALFQNLQDGCRIDAWESGTLDYRNPQVVVKVPSCFESWCAAMCKDLSRFHATRGLSHCVCNDSLCIYAEGPKARAAY